MAFSRSVDQRDPWGSSCLGGKAFGCKSLSTLACSLPSCSHAVHLQWEDVVFTALDPGWLQGSCLGDDSGGPGEAEPSLSGSTGKAWALHGSGTPKEGVCGKLFLWGLAHNLVLPGHAALSGAKGADLLWWHYPPEAHRGFHKHEK